MPYLTKDLIKFSRVALAFSALTLSACLDEATSSNNNANYNAELSTDEIRTDLGKISWILNHEYQIEKLTDTLAQHNTFVNNCTVPESSITRQYDNPSGVFQSQSTWTNKDGKAMEVCYNAEGGLSEYYALLDGSTIRQNQTITSDSLNSKQSLITTYHIPSADSMSFSIGMTMEMQYAIPYQINISVTLNSNMSKATSESNISGVLSLMDGRYRCDVTNIGGTTDSEDDSSTGDQTTPSKSCDITHAGEVVASMWEYDNEEGESKGYFTDLDGNIIADLNP